MRCWTRFISATNDELRCAVPKERKKQAEKYKWAEAPPAPRRGAKFFVLIGVFLLILAWSVQGAKIRPGELFEGIPQIGITIARMLPPDFSKVTDLKNYYLPEGFSLAELLLPLPLATERAGAKQRWRDNTFPQTVLGATLETVQIALAGTLLALLVACPVGFPEARQTTPHPRACQ